MAEVTMLTYNSLGAAREVQQVGQGRILDWEEVERGVRAAEVPL